jgi:hypothetical protein
LTAKYAGHANTGGCRAGDREGTTDEGSFVAYLLRAPGLGWRGLLGGDRGKSRNFNSTRTNRIVVDSVAPAKRRPRRGPFAGGTRTRSRPLSGGMLYPLSYSSTTLVVAQAGAVTGNRKMSREAVAITRYLQRGDIVLSIVPLRPERVILHPCPWRGLRVGNDIPRLRLHWCR